MALERLSAPDQERFVHDVGALFEDYIFYRQAKQL